ncbi:MAG: ATP-binding protein [Clostridia bacterium]|nr:ATP-binding protein [Clostridia bacterium]
MAYRRSVYIKAKNILEERRRKAEAEQEKRRAAAISVCPEIAETERDMARFAAEVIKSVSMGQDAEQFVLSLSQKNLEAQEKRKLLLERNGFPADYLETKYTCPICKDTGSHDGYYCKCYLDLIKQTAKDELGVAPSMKKCTFDSFNPELYSNEVDSELSVSPRRLAQGTLNFCKKYAEEFSLSSKNIIMLGKTGVGKTHLSLAIAGKVIDRGFDVYYASIHKIMDALQKEQFSRDRVDESITDRLYESDLLVIDDLGAEFSTQFTVAALYNIVNTRLNASRPMIINTNLTLGELEERYSQRVASRIIGSSDCVMLIGDDIRQKLSR